jgi:hypothetical protein
MSPAVPPTPPSDEERGDPLAMGSQAAPDPEDLAQATEAAESAAPEKVSDGGSGDEPDAPAEEPPVSAVATSGVPASPASRGDSRSSPLPLPPYRRRDSAPAAPRFLSPRGRTTPYPMPGDDDPQDDPRGPALPRSPVAVHLSPRMTAIFGGLFGLACVTSIVALLIQVVPPRDERVVASTTAHPKSRDKSKAAPAPTVKKRVRVALPSPWRLKELEKDSTVRIESAKMERRSFVDALAEKGVPTAQAYRIMKAFDGVRTFEKAARKDRFTVAMERSSKRVKAFEYQVSPSEIYQAREGADGLLVGAKLDMKIAEAEYVGAFYVTGDIETAYVHGGFEDGILPALNEALSGRLSTESFQEGGVVKVIAIEETALGLFSRYKRIVAMEYRPPDPSQKPVRIYSFTGQESRGYFDERGKQPFGGGWRSPCPGAPVTSRFNPKRMHPILKKVMPHNGTDFGAPTGTPVYAAYRGVVDFVGPNGPTGNWVSITHPNGVETGYAHLSKFAPGLKVGDKVGTHQLIGYVGTTGRSTGPHLHLSARKDGKFFDAESLKFDGERVLPAVDRQAFSATKADLDKRLEAIPLPEPPPQAPKPAAAAPAAQGSQAAPAQAAAAPADKKGKDRTARQVATPAALASAAAEPGFHPSTFVEDNSEDDGDDPKPVVPKKAPVDDEGE